MKIHFALLGFLFLFTASCEGGEINISTESFLSNLTGVYKTSYKDTNYEIWIEEINKYMEHSQHQIAVFIFEKGKASDVQQFLTKYPDVQSYSNSICNYVKENTDQFSNVLKDYVFEQRKINPKLSESQIAHKLGISNATFYRIINRHTRPTVKTLFTLCKSIPEMKDFVTDKMLEVTRESKTGEYIGSELESLIADKNYFISYALALSDNGVTKKEILYCIGHEGEKALKDLLKKGFIKKDNNKVYRALEGRKGIILSFNILKKHLKILADNYKPDNIKNNYIYYKMETLNKEGIRKLHEIHKEKHRKVQEIMEDARYKGDMPIFSAGFCDMLFLKESDKER